MGIDLSGQRMKIDNYVTPPIGLVDDLYGFYAETFEQINRLAAQRHLMTEHEYKTVQYDDRVTKYVAYDDEGIPIGQSCITNDLAAWPLVSPAYFEHRWPDLYLDHRIWYVGYVCAHLDAARHGVFGALLIEMAPPVVDSRGVAVMDVCARNLWKPDVPNGAGRALSMLSTDLRYGRIDAQEFWAYRFDGCPV